MTVLRTTWFPPAFKPTVFYPNDVGSPSRYISKYLVENEPKRFYTIIHTIESFIDFLIVKQFSAKLDVVSACEKLSHLRNSIGSCTGSNNSCWL